MVHVRSVGGWDVRQEGKEIGFMLSIPMKVDSMFR